MRFANWLTNASLILLSLANRNQRNPWDGPCSMCATVRAFFLATMTRYVDRVCWGWQCCSLRCYSRRYGGNFSHTYYQVRILRTALSLVLSGEERRLCSMYRKSRRGIKIALLGKNNNNILYNECARYLIAKSRLEDNNSWSFALFHTSLA